MTAPELEFQVEGVVRSQRTGGFRPWVQIEGADEDWVLDYDYESPFHEFARKVAALGKPYRPSGPYRAGSPTKPLGHFRVLTLRIVGMTGDAQLLEVGTAQVRSGQFDRRQNASGEWTLFFVTDQGEVFQVFNDPAEAMVGRNAKVLAYPVQPSPLALASSPAGLYLWVICRYSLRDRPELAEEPSSE